MVVGSDERRYAWMDEGFNTFINHYSNLAYYGDDASRARRTSGAFIAQQMQSPIADQPIMTAEVDFTISENPNFRFYFVPKEAGELKAVVIDTKDRRFESTVRVELEDAAAAGR